MTGLGFIVEGGAWRWITRKGEPQVAARSKGGQWV